MSQSNKASASGSETILPKMLEKVLLENVAPIAMAPERQAAVRVRILNHIRPVAPASFINMRSADGSWEPLNPKVDIKRLYADGNMSAFLLRFQAGGRIDAHSHAHIEECLVLEGEIYLDDTVFRPGEYQIAGAGSRHAQVYSASGCLMFVRRGLTA